MTQSMAVSASLALAVKLKKIFEKDDRYLTFPTGIGFAYDYLEFIKDPSRTSLSLQEQLNFKADFSRLMNTIPQDNPNFMPNSSEFLWDELKSVLDDCIFAPSTLTSDEERQLAEAIDFLTDDLDGFQVYSPQVSKYYEYKTIYDETVRTYEDEKMSVQFAEGDNAEELKEQWDAYRKKQLKEACDKAEQDWINLGYKRQVEEYQSAKNNLEIRKYLNRYRRDYLDELAVSEIADLNGQGIGFLTTFFSPLDAFDKTMPWTRVTLTKSEISKLITEADSQLKTRFETETGNVDIEAISLEYNNVIIIRPWFKPEFFESRYWKLPDARVVSNGQLPRDGILPAYITSMIVARNVKITQRKEVAQQELVLPLVSKTSLQNLKLSDSKPEVFRKGRNSHGRPGAHLKSHNNRIVNESLYRGAKTKGLTIRKTATRPIISEKQDDDLRLGSRDNKLVTETTEFDGISVIALVCHRLPKSPNPDSSLRW